MLQSKDSHYLQKNKRQLKFMSNHDWVTRHIHGQKEIQEAIAGEMKQPKPLFSRIEELYFSKEVKESALASEDKSFRP